MYKQANTPSIQKNLLSLSCPDKGGVSCGSYEDINIDSGK